MRGLVPRMKLAMNSSPGGSRPLLGPGPRQFLFCSCRTLSGFHSWISSSQFSENKIPMTCLFYFTDLQESRFHRPLTLSSLGGVFSTLIHSFRSVKILKQSSRWLHEGRQEALPEPAGEGL